MSEDEEFVRAHWERAEFCPKPRSQEGCISLGGRGFTRLTVSDTISGYAGTESLAWQAAAEFTRERLEEVRLAKIDVAQVEHKLFISCGIDNCEQCASAKRILAREQAHLESLRRGML